MTHFSKETIDIFAPHAIRDHHRKVVVAREGSGKFHLKLSSFGTEPFLR
jgi:hypothetical protein